jgi:hypothetical protein
MPNGAVAEPQEMPNGAEPGRPAEELYAEASGHPDDAGRPRWPDSH